MEHAFSDYLRYLVESSSMRRVECNNRNCPSWTKPQTLQQRIIVMTTPQRITQQSFQENCKDPPMHCKRPITNQHYDTHGGTEYTAISNSLDGSKSKERLYHCSGFLVPKETSFIVVPNLLILDCHTYQVIDPNSVNNDLVQRPAATLTLSTYMGDIEYQT
ncbi:hypothetical protein BGZ82_003988, partial [Podila clonocystis]